MQVQGKSPLDYQAGILQALTLINGADLAEATTADRGPLLLALDAPLFADAERLETMFLATVTRLPSANERDLFMKHVGTRSPREKGKAWGDVLWALLNTAEFGTNH